MNMDEVTGLPSGSRHNNQRRIEGRKAPFPDIHP